jgi:hypothetical protein
LDQNPASLPPAVQEDDIPLPTVLPIHDEPYLVTAADFATGIPFNFTIEVLADIMHKTVDLLGDEVTTKRLKTLTFVGSSHAKKLASYKARLFIVLEKHHLKADFLGMQGPHMVKTPFSQVMTLSQRLPHPGTPHDTCHPPRQHRLALLSSYSTQRLLHTSKPTSASPNATRIRAHFSHHSTS